MSKLRSCMDVIVSVRPGYDFRRTCCLCGFGTRREGAEVSVGERMVRSSCVVAFCPICTGNFSLCL